MKESSLPGFVGASKGFLAIMESWVVSGSDSPSLFTNADNVIRSY